MAEDSKAVIVLRLNGRNLSLKRNIDNKIEWFEEELVFDQENQEHSEYTIYWILNKLKPVFYSMPIEKIVIDCTPDVLEKFKNTLTLIDHFVTHTNNFLKQIKHLKNSAVKNDRILFYNVGDDERSRMLYEYIQDQSAHPVEYKTFDPGFDPVKRQWEKVGVPESFDSLLSFIKEKKISKIVSINHYLLENYLSNTGVNLVALFKFLGVEYIIYDIDEYSQGMCGYMKKCFYNCDSFSRISHTVWHETFDKRLDMNNIHYSVIPQKFSDNNAVRQLNEDYHVVILSHCRLESVKSMIRPILFFLDYFNDKNILSDLQTWYCSIFYMIQNIMKLDDFQVHHYNRILTGFYYHVTNFLKYEIIDRLETQRKILVYGDEGWNQIFPQYYQKYITPEEKAELIESGGFLFLLMNWSALYTSTNGPVYDAVAYGMPFINYPPFVKTDELEGLKHLEYCDFDDLNSKVNNVNPYFENKELIKSLSYYKSLLNQEQTYVAKSIATGTKMKVFDGEYGEQRQKLKALFEEKVIEFIDANEAMLRASFDILIAGKEINYDHTKSRYFNKSYMLKLRENGLFDQ